MTYQTSCPTAISVRNGFYNTMVKWLSVPLFFLFCLVSVNGIAATRIALENGFELRFKEGVFDPKTLNMQVSSLELYHDGELGLLADEFLLETAPHADGKRLLIKKLEINSLVVPEGGLKIDSIKARNFIINERGDLFNDDIESVMVNAMDNAYLGVFDFWIPGHDDIDYDLYFQSIEITPIRQKILPSGDDYFAESGLRGSVELKHRKTEERNRLWQGDGLTKAATIKKLGGETIKFVFDLKNEMSDDGTLIYTRTTGSLNVEQQFDAKIDLHAQAPLATFLEVMKKGRIDDDAAWEILQSDVSIANMALDIREHGFFDRLIALYAEDQAQSPDAAREEIRLLVDENMRETFPNEGPRLAQGVDHFLRQGGKLRISMAPDAPVPLFTVAGFLIMPDIGVKELNVTTERVD